MNYLLFLIDLIENSGVKLLTQDKNIQLFNMINNKGIYFKKLTPFEKQMNHDTNILYNQCYIRLYNTPWNGISIKKIDKVNEIIGYEPEHGLTH